MCKLVYSVLHEETGAETIEYALVLGLIVVAAIAIITHVGKKVTADWKTVKKGLK